MDRPATVVAAVGLLLAPVVGWAATRAPLLALAGAVVLAGGLALFRWPRLGAYALVATFPFSTLFISTGFAHLSPDDLVCMAMVPVWVLYRLAYPSRLRLPRYWPLLALFLGLCFASLSLGVNPARGQGAYLRTVTYVLAAFVVVDLGADRRFLHRALWIMAATGALHALFALPEVGRSTRVEGLVGQSNILAHLLGMSIMASLGLSELERGRGRRLALLGTTALMLAILTLTVSRGTYVAIAVALLWWARHSRIQLTVAALAVAAVAFITEQADRSHIERIEARLRFEDGRSAVNRVATARNALRAIEHHPLLGVGFGQFRELDAAIQMTQQFDRSAHSFYLSVAASAGLPALFALALFAGLTVRDIRRRRAAADALGPEGRAWASQLRTLQGILLFLGVSLVTKDDGKPRFWVVMGLASAAATLAVPRPREGDAQPALSASSRR